MKTFYPQSITAMFVYTLAGAFVGMCAGYLCGAVGGLIMTFYNNNFLTDTAQADYLWWANFGGLFIAFFAVLPSAAVGFLAGLTIRQRANSAISNKRGEHKSL